MTHRRAFVATAACGGALLSGFTALPALACESVARRVGGSPIQAVFDGLVGERFQLDLGGGQRASLQLQAVRGRAAKQPIEQFSLVLRGSAGRPIDSGVYRMAHARSGRFELRLEPSGHDAEGRLYRADFSLLV